MRQVGYQSFPNCKGGQTIKFINPKQTLRTKRGVGHRDGIQLYNLDAGLDLYYSRTNFSVHIYSYW